MPSQVPCSEASSVIRTFLFSDIPTVRAHLTVREHVCVFHTQEALPLDTLPGPLLKGLVSGANTARNEQVWAQALLLAGLVVSACCVCLCMCKCCQAAALMYV